jgi:LacI family transcriptional regulator
MPERPEKRDCPRVALLVESSRAYGRGLLLGIGRYVREHGPWSVFLQERGLGDVGPKWLNNWRGHGVIARIENLALARTIQRLRLPTVDLRHVLAGIQLPSVRADEEAIARLAAKHLLERGFRRFAYCGFAGLNYSDIRCAAFCGFLRREGIECEIYTDVPQPAGWNTMVLEEDGWRREPRLQEWILRLPKPAGLMACNDIRGQQVLNACRNGGVAVPDELAVIGVDNDEVLCNLADPPLTSVAPNSERIGYEAAALLDRLMQGAVPTAEPVYVAPTGIVTRRSTEVLAIEDHYVAGAVRYIRDHAGECPTVGDLLKRVPVSHSALERRFIKVLGHSPKEEILRARLRLATQFLSQTELPLARIADRIGFEHPEYFSVIFKKKLGLTPRQYRQRFAISSAARASTGPFSLSAEKPQVIAANVQ